MRLTGTVQEAAGLGCHDHLSWPYDDRDDFRRQVTGFIAEGLALGLRVMYAADGPTEALKADLAALPGLDGALESGALVLTSLADIYDLSQPVDPDRTLAAFAAATEEALAAGYSGLRAAGDATALLGTPEHVAGFAAWEAKVDRFMLDHPFSAMCSFDRSQIPDGAAETLACVHPTTLEGASMFRLYASDTGADLGLAGELDHGVTEDFARALELSAAEVAGELVIDAEDLEFVDHRAMYRLRDFARRLGTTVVLRTRSRLPSRLIDLLDIDGIRVEMLPAGTVAP